MNLTEREKKIFKEILANGKIKESQLLDAGYYESEIAEIKDNKEWRDLYRNIDDLSSIERTKQAIQNILGANWKTKYDYNEGRKRGKYHLSICIDELTFNKICKVGIGLLKEN